MATRYIGSTPWGEPCAQVGAPDYNSMAELECEVFTDLLRRHFGPEVGSARLVTTVHPHDFGGYLGVDCAYDDDDEAAAEYALRIEDDYPEEWDDEARADLAEKEYGL